MSSFVNSVISSYNLYLDANGKQQAAFLQDLPASAMAKILIGKSTC